MTETKAIAVRAKPEDLARVEGIIAEFSAAGGSADSGHFGRAFTMAAAIRALHQAITPEMMKEIMRLQGTGLGFLTDKDDPAKNNPPGYPEADVKLVAIEAALMGAHWVGNEFNIISCRPYLTKNFFTRKLREFPGLTDLKLSPGVPVMVGEKGALVPYVATWKLNGQDMRAERLLKKIDDKTDLDERIPIRVNSGMGIDAILGKAERKIKAQIYNRLTGSDLTDGEADDVPPKLPPVSTMDDLAKRLEDKSGAGNGNGTNGRGQQAEADTPTIATVREELPGIDAIGEVEGLKASMRKKATTDQERATIDRLCDERANEIRASRKRETAGAT